MLFSSLAASLHSGQRELLFLYIKKGAPDDKNNYRGITLISCLGKVFTSVINQRLIDWSTASEISTDAQFGFKPGHSAVQETFTYNGEDLEIVREFNYLGYVVSSGGKMQKAINLLADKAVRAMGLLFSTIRMFRFLLKCCCNYLTHTLSLF